MLNKSILWSIGILSLVMASHEGGTIAQDPSESDRSQFVIENCTVSLIDHAILASDRPGLLAKVTTREGTVVKQGTVLAQLRNDVARAAFDVAAKEAENDVNARLAVASKKVADIEHDNVLSLFLKKAETEYHVRRLELAAIKAGLSVEQARHEHEISQLRMVEARERLREHDVVAPFDGIVIGRFRSVGESVRQGDAIVEIASVRRLKVEGYVEPARVHELQTGAAVDVGVELLSADGTKRSVTLQGKLVFVDLSVTPIQRRVRVWAEIDNADGLLWPGMMCTMRIQPRSEVL